MQLKDVVNYPKTVGAEEKTRMSGSAESRVTGLFGESTQAMQAINELKGAGFPEDRIAVAMQDNAAQEMFSADNKVHKANAEETPGVPELDAEQVLLLVDAADQTELALEIINRNRGVTGGVRMPS